MNKTIFFTLFFMTSQHFFAQSNYIEELFVELSGNASNADFSNNTYFIANSACNVSWQVIRDSIPNGWEFSFCFPNCYDPGVTTGNSFFSENTEQFLNCHIYPNNIAGNGFIEMEITTDNTYKDTLVWSASAIDNLFLSEKFKKPKGEVLYLYNLDGRRIINPTINQVVLIQYDTGIVEKNIVTSNNNQMFTN